MEFTVRIESPDILQAAQIIAGMLPNILSRPVMSELSQTTAPVQQTLCTETIPETQTATVGLPTTNVTYTVDELSKAAAIWANGDPAQRTQVTELIKAFGVSKLSELPNEHIGGFAIMLKEIGVTI